MDALLTNQWLVFASIFGCLILAAVGIIGALNRDPARRRFRGSIGETSEHTASSVSIIHDDKRSAALRLIEPFQKAIAQSDPVQVKTAKSKLVQAGYYRPSAVEIYFTARLVLGISLAVLGGLYIYFVKPTSSTSVSLLYIVGGAALGYYLPLLIVNSRLAQRQRSFKLGIPDALDMILVGVEAGLSLPAAMQHIVDEFADTHPIVAEQFQTVVLEFQAGKSRADALRGMSTRMDLQETRTMASMIIQSETMGTSLAQTLRVIADELRAQRMLDAEKKASELPVKMAVPLVLCIFPALMAVALVPAILQTLEFFSSIG